MRCGGRTEAVADDYVEFVTTAVIDPGAHRVGREPVVAISEHDPFAARERDAGVARRRYASIFLRDDANARIALGRGFEHGERVVGGAIAHGDDFALDAALAEKRIEQREEEPDGAIISRHDDAGVDARGSHGWMQKKMGRRHAQSQGFAAARIFTFR